MARMSLGEPDLGSGARSGTRPVDCDVSHGRRMKRKMAIGKPIKGAHRPALFGALTRRHVLQGPHRDRFPQPKEPPEPPPPGIGEATDSRQRLDAPRPPAKRAVEFGKEASAVANAG